MLQLGVCSDPQPYPSFPPPKHMKTLSIRSCVNFFEGVCVCEVVCAKAVQFRNENPF